MEAFRGQILLAAKGVRGGLGLCISPRTLSSVFWHPVSLHVCLHVWSRPFGPDSSSLLSANTHSSDEDAV